MEDAAHASNSRVETAVDWEIGLEKSEAFMGSRKGKKKRYFGGILWVANSGAHTVTFLEEAMDDMGSKVAGTACNTHFHDAKETMMKKK